MTLTFTTKAQLLTARHVFPITLSYTKIMLPSLITFPVQTI